MSTALILSGGGARAAYQAGLSALFAAGRYDELLALIDKARFKWWHDRRWCLPSALTSRSGR